MASGYDNDRLKEAAKAALTYPPASLKETVLTSLEAFIIHHQGIVSGQYIELQGAVERDKNNPELCVTVAQFYKNLAAIEGDLRLLEEVHSILSNVEGDFEPIGKDILKLTIQGVTESATQKQLAVA